MTQAKVLRSGSPFISKAIPCFSQISTASFTEIETKDLKCFYCGTYFYNNIERLKHRQKYHPDKPDYHNGNGSFYESTVKTSAINNIIYQSSSIPNN